MKQAPAIYPDDSIWFQNGCEGIVVGVDHEHDSIAVLWVNGVVTKHKIKALMKLVCHHRHFS